MEVQDGDGNADVVATKAKVFVSYSRKDREFADELVRALNVRRFTAYLDTKEAQPQIVSFPVRQVVAEGQVATRAGLASNLYIAGEHDLPAGSLALPWDAQRANAVGEFARIQGARVPGRLVSSAKSWLCHGGVDREAAILPWGSDTDVKKVSPVAASAAYLQHIREAWELEFPDAPMAQQDVILTVPASFDEVARELTVPVYRAWCCSKSRRPPSTHGSINITTIGSSNWHTSSASWSSISVVGRPTSVSSPCSIATDRPGSNVWRSAITFSLAVTTSTSRSRVISSRNSAPDSTVNAGSRWPTCAAARRKSCSVRNRPQTQPSVSPGAAARWSAER